MGKLSPKPKTNIKKLTWEDLDHTLKCIFESTADESPSATIECSLYEMTKDEIITEASNQGYKVSETAPGYLTFE
ncbi:hypothetical protein PWF76_06980 [Streptococcus suis]|uniref:hypothetical protein n=1 Tax=Streptococcus suis TaxID=1307 RepID=UPI00237CD71D|nr:hypothetical protein [Streptococcus suis]MDE1692439.1 hypothetical protein [Streptococcus suis]